MGRTKKVITQVVAIMLLLGILTVGVCGLYIGMDELDKPVLLKSDSVDNSFEVDGQRFYVRHDGIYDANGVLYVGFADESTNNKIETKGPGLEEIFGIEDANNDEFSIFGASRSDLQKLYIQSVLKSVNSGRTIHVSRWVTSGDCSQDDDDMTITIP